MSKKFICFGDIHFSSINKWNFDAGENFIKWFESQDFGNPDDIELGFVGDIAERDVNPGNVVDQIDRFFDSASKKAKHVYVIVGNHDKKLYHDIEQHSLVFLEKKGNITVYEKETVTTTENGFKILFLPHQRILGSHLWEYYNSLGEEWTKPHYDALLGHWNIQEDSKLEWKQQGVDITRFDATCMCIGHVHNRVRDEYIGSVFPNNIDEYDPNHPRGYKVLNEDRTVEFVEMPEFLKYQTIELGDEPPEPEKDCAVVYTVKNCVSELEAEERYPNLLIRGIERETLFSKDGVNVSTSEDGFSAINPADLMPALDEMIKEMGLTVSRTVYNDLKKLLNKTTA